MTSTTEHPHAGEPVNGSASGRIVISVDAMGGDRGPSAVVEGCVQSLRADPQIDILLHGDKAALEPLIAREPALAGRLSVAHADGVVTMHDKPSHIMRHGKDTSMWSTIAALKDGRGHAAVSCGNTGALMAVSMLQLRRMEGVNRPAIACLWPARGRHGFNTMLDVGADVKAEAEDLLAYAIMGVTYFRNGFGEPRPRVGLLNVGTEEHKGRAEIKAAHELIAKHEETGRYEFVGFVEGSDIPSDRVDVIVTDGFTGNIALKTGEGTAKLISDFLRESFKSGPLAMLGAVLARGALKRLGTRIDPRRVNGGVFLGLNGTVVKSHGSADAMGVAAAIGLAAKLAQSGYQGRMAERLVIAAKTTQDAAPIGDSA
ncbi:phosphate acyltransferase PlsX [Pararhodobacter sp. CCB-MM2]|uniref:phosphate acyltransferase PlsX n=1 Tax=Pararhodobacter sp. CCB-MM2 TaxID=1786003 RepID=UPI0009F1E0B6|nr:phosphate acyltransferase PlsX [Pararhodobacter sp. CCB-MM2]MCA2010769.1 phosphate acyltransferase PlsX [Cereibacter sphaeroides]